MSRLRIGCIEYINALPFFLPLRLKAVLADVELIFGAPSHINRLFREKAVDIALVSSVEYLKGNYTQLPGFGIAADQEIMSVNFYTRTSLDHLSNQLVGVTAHSATAKALLELLCRHYWKIHPHFEVLDDLLREKYEGLLLIGDKALQTPQLDGYQKLDLGQMWYRFSNLPFVYALFVAQPTVLKPQLSNFTLTLQQALDWSETHKDIIAQEALKKCPIDERCLKKYFSLLRNRLEKKDIQSLNYFKELIS